MLQSKLLGIIPVLLLLLVVILPAKGAIVNSFTDEADQLIQLQIIPAELDLARDVTSRQYVTLLERLINGRGSDVLVNLTAQIELPEMPISYLEAITIGGIFLGHDRESSYSKVKAMTEDLRKNDEDKLTGFEMAYIFYQILHTNRVGQTKSVLEERYIVGDSPRIVSGGFKLQDNQIIIDDKERLMLARDFQAFIINDNQIKPIDVHQVVISLSDVKLLFDSEGLVKTAITNKEYSLSQIRVLLSQELDQLGSSKSYDFSEIQIKATQPFKIETRENGMFKTELVAEKDEVITFTNQQGLVYFTTGNGKVTRSVDGRVYLKSYYSHTICFDPLLSTPRRGNIPVYAGTLEIFAADTPGYLHLVNELPLEMYLRKVVPGQIPSSWSEETFKVQAIAARSYAITQINRGKFKDKSAHVDDSTASQIYNNITEIPEINEAIKETEGVVGLHNGQVIDAVYFSTSAGYTANNEDVWHNYQNNEFPGIPVPYLRSTSGIPDKPFLNLDTEAKALAFFKDQTIKGYDSISPYYRWVIELTREELENTINKNLPIREATDKAQGTDFIRTLKGSFIFPNDSSFSIGKLEDIRVVQRGQGGNIMVLDITGTNGKYRIIKEYNIRFLIRPSQKETGSRKEILIYTHDGGAIADYPILPSAFAAFEIIRNSLGDISTVKIYGGGMGHGVGLSQWGMKGMVQQGATYEEILKHFYSGITLKKIY